ncbi:hypothetical protein LCGC14_0413260 [marine sediment metagenome]|uniref:DOD-type homing endonuclease domain-containing protein n=1 Tax=marine sediment metagenome TaxID=412755 RepID=A0A0F9SYZ9_9ZZZZ
MKQEDVNAAVAELADVVPLVKAHLVGRDDVEQPNAVQVREDELARTFSQLGAIEPPFDPETLCLLLEHSNALRQNIDAYVTNIDGFGHKFEPVINLESDEAPAQIANAIYIERLRQQEAGEETTFENLDPTKEEVDAKIIELHDLMRREKSKLVNFFEFCCADVSFVSLRRRMRQDIEVLGNAYWEIIRNGAGEIAQFNYIPGYTMRLLSLDATAVDVETKIKISDLEFDTIKMQRQFRKLVQVVEGKSVWFKELGDPRVISRKTGKEFKDVEALKKNDPMDGPAHEVLHFKIHNPRSAYGTPRWIGNLLSVMGSRQSEEVNFLYFENKSIPPMVMLVSGGRVSSETISRVEDHVKNASKGRRNFHKILVLEGESDATAGGGKMKIELKPLTQAIYQDALFQKYDERNIDKVGMSFRLPRMLRGDIRDFNRACYDERTETLTRRGWLRLDQFRDDDEIAAYHPGQDNVEFTRPDALHVYEVDEELLHFRSAVADVMVTEDHRMLARPLGAERFEVHASQSIPWPRYALKTTVGHADGTRLDGFTLPKDDGCQIERGHDHVSSVAGDDFVAFLGYWLSEGSLLSTNHPSAPYLVTLSQRDGGTADAIRACLKRTGWAFSESCDEVAEMRRWQLSNRCLSSWLREHCGSDSGSKRIPDIARDLCPEQTRILFNALMAGDGHWDSRPGRNSGFYPSVSRGLCDDVQVLALRLGHRATLSLHYAAHDNRRACWRVLISVGRDAEFRDLPERVHYQGRVYCFSVPEYGFYVTRRNGKVAVQGNTAQAALVFAEAQVFQPEREEFDFIINRKILTDMGIRFWRFRSNGPITKDAAQLTEMIATLLRAGAIVPSEARQLAEDVFNREFKRIDAFWTEQPLQLSVVGAGPGEEPDRGGDKADLTVQDLAEEGGLLNPEQARRRPQVPPSIGKRRLVAQAAHLIKVRDAIRAEERRQAEDEFLAAKDEADDGEPD